MAPWASLTGSGPLKRPLTFFKDGSEVTWSLNVEPFLHWKRAQVSWSLGMAPFAPSSKAIWALGFSGGIQGVYEGSPSKGPHQGTMYLSHELWAYWRCMRCTVEGWCLRGTGARGGRDFVEPGVREFRSSKIQARNLNPKLKPNPCGVDF